MPLMKTILIIAYEFPPIGGSGVQRTLKFAKYLPSFGWQPLILTIREDAAIIRVKDASLLSEVPENAFIFRTDLFDPYDNFLHHLIMGTRNRYSTQVKKEKNQHFGQKIKTSISSFLNGFFVPDQLVGWYPYAVRKGSDVIKRYQPDLIFSTSPAETTHVIARALAKKFRLPWVADFRDPWTSSGLAIERLYPMKKLEKWLERKVLDNASAVITVTEECRLDFLLHDPSLDFQKFHCIPNGYDEEDFDSVVAKKFGKFTIVFIGRLYKENSIKNIFQALNLCFEENPEMRKNTAFLFIGEQYPTFRELVLESGLHDVVEQVSYQEHKASLSYLLGAHMCFYDFCAKKERSKIPLHHSAKIYEYLRSGTFILAVIPDDLPVATIINETQSGVVIQAEAIADIKQQFLERYTLFREGQHSKNTKHDTEKLRVYTRKNLTKNLVSVLEGLLRKKYFLGGGADSDENVRHQYQGQFPYCVGVKQEQADGICQHIFTLLGSEPTRVSSEHTEKYQPIDWHSDFKSGFRWSPKTFHRQIQYGDILGADVKVPWELSRFQHLILLGQAYLLTRDEKYSQEFQDQLNDWINNNSVGYGVNWASPMDIAIRVANWLVAQEYFSECDSISKEFWQKFYQSVHAHGKFIFRHLENKGRVRNNHYIANLAGLFFIATYVPSLKESRKWQAFSIQELSREIHAQVYADGCSFEGSTTYHCLALEIFYYVALLAKRAGILLSNHYQDRLKKMFVVLRHCTKPDGTISQIGDHDNGRFLIFSRRPILEQHQLLALAAIHYEESQFKLSSLKNDEEKFWLFDQKAISNYDQLPFHPTSLSSRAFEEAGWYILRDENHYCFISCGRNGQKGKGGHDHNDKLSFTLMIQAKDVIVDPGTYVYTPYPEERNKFRSTGYHNVINVENYEQNAFLQNNLFRLSNQLIIEKAHLNEDPQKVVFAGSIRYGPIMHQRIITLFKNSGVFQIEDVIASTKGAHMGCISLHLSPTCLCVGKEIVDAENGKVPRRIGGGRM